MNLKWTFQNRWAAISTMMCLCVLLRSPSSHSQTAPWKSAMEFYVSRDWIPLSHPDQRLAPGAILSFSDKDGLRYLSSLSTCGVPAEAIRSRPIADANLQFGNNLSYDAAAILALSGVSEGPGYSKVQSASLRAEYHHAVLLDIEGFARWITNPTNAGSIRHECQTILRRPDSYIVQESYELLKGQYSIRDASGTLINIGTASPPPLSIAPNAGLTISKEGSLEFEQPLYTAVKNLISLGDILNGSATLGSTKGPTVPTPQIDRHVQSWIIQSTVTSHPIRTDGAPFPGGGAGGGSRPPPPPSVYNAIFAPTLANTTADLIDGKATTVVFFIGPSAPGNTLDATNQKVSATLLNDKSNSKLLVTMTCRFCKDIGVQKQYIGYSGKNQLSDKATFQFIPLREKIAGDTGVARLGFRITKDGVDLNNVFANVRVNPAGVVAGAGPISQPSLADSSVVLAPTPSARDIDLKISIRSGIGERLEASIEPGTSEVEALFHGKQRMPDGSLRWFRTGVMKDDVPKLEGQLYLQLVATIDNDQGLKAVLSGSPAVAKDEVSSALLSDDDQQTLVKLLATKGRVWYHELFVSGPDADLGRMLESFRTYSRKDRPLRVRIESEGIYLPWQILIAPTGAAPRAEDFWGFRYELSVDPTGINLPDRYLSLMQYKAGPLIYGQYRGAAEDDVVARLASDELTYLQATLGIKGILATNSRDAFRDALTKYSDSLQLVVTFTHGGNGTLIDKGGEITQDAAGQKLIFAPNEYLPVADINDLQGNATGKSLFTNAPVVFLNGCETGTAGFYATTNQDFAGTFLALGSRGVIVTEAPIWQYFGYNFGISLLKQINGGQPITSALLKTRQTYLQKAKNPLGLLYSYYGGADAAVLFK